MDCDFDNDAMTCPRCGFVAGWRDWHKNCTGPPTFRDQHPEACRHRGDEVRIETCASCTDGEQWNVKIFACPLRGECTVGKKLPGIVCCALFADCSDFAARGPAG